MGDYINHTKDGQRLPRQDKADALIADGAVEITRPAQHSPTTVAVVENHAWDAALLVDNEHDYKRVLAAIQAGDERPLRWVDYPHAQATVTRAGVTAL